MYLNLFRRLMDWLVDCCKRLQAPKIILLISILFLLAGCSVASAGVDPSLDPVRSSLPHGALSLPPVWTPTQEDLSFKSHSSSSPEIGITPTSEPDTPFNFYQEYLVIGHSVEGRPLEVYRFGNGPRDLMIVAGIHGGYEWNTIALADELIEYLYFHPDQIHPLLSIHILRSLNPDGATLKSNPLGRGNANHVDLNRNWDSSWSADIPKPNCWDLIPLSAGPYPGSEPETRALMQYILEAHIKAMISYHSAGLGIFAGGKPPTEDSLSLAEAIASVSDYPYPPIDTGCEYTGTMTDWAADNGIAAIDVELSTHLYTDFEQNLVILQTFLDWRPE